MKPDPLQAISQKCVTASDLVVGGPYFIVNHLADNVPIIRSVVYLGRDLSGEDADEYWFQDAESYEIDGPFPGKGGAVDVIVTGPVLPPNLFGFEGIIEELDRLMRLRQRKRA